jgi:hypothetical protein
MPSIDVQKRIAPGKRESCGPLRAVGRLVGHSEPDASVVYLNGCARRNGCDAMNIFITGASGFVGSPAPGCRRASDSRHVPVIVQ